MREIVLARIEQTIRRACDDAPPDELDLKSDEELLAWYDRFQTLGRDAPSADVRRKVWRVDA